MVYCEGDDIISVEILPSMEDVKKKVKRNVPGEDEIHSAVKEAVRSVNRNLPAYKRIRKVVIRKEEFNKTSTHKIKR